VAENNTGGVRTRGIIGKTMRNTSGACQSRPRVATTLDAVSQGHLFITQSTSLVGGSTPARLLETYVYTTRRCP